MDEPLLFGEEELRFLTALLAEEVDFMLVGLAAAALQGAPVVTQDVDLWFKDLTDPGLRSALDRVGGAYIPPTGDRPPMLAGGGAKLFDIVVHMQGLGPFEEEQQNTILVDLDGVGVPVLSLERIIASKEASGRQKDRLALPVLRDALATLDPRADEDRDSNA
ncbi:MAG: hypothetical protein R6W82_03345 [bacterium]